MRINKYLAQHGYCSRREADRLIERGNVLINGELATLGDMVRLDDNVQVSGRARKEKPDYVYIMLNKPVGYITTSDRRKKDNVLDLIEINERIFPVGRLDVKSSGLLLFTNDGDLANRLTHPRYEHDKEYIVIVDKEITRLDIGKLQNGIKLDDGKTLPAKVRRLDTNKVAIILREGRNQQIRRMFAELGYEVLTLTRTRVVSVTLGHLSAGDWRHLTEKELKLLEKEMKKKPVR
jgi:23S rRNA pseudouridine2604 synthase